MALPLQLSMHAAAIKWSVLPLAFSMDQNVEFSPILAQKEALPIPKSPFASKLPPPMSAIGTGKRWGM